MSMKLYRANDGTRTHEWWYHKPGRTMGLEPTNGGTTNHCLNHLANPRMVVPQTTALTTWLRHEWWYHKPLP